MFSRSINPRSILKAAQAFSGNGKLIDVFFKCGIGHWWAVNSFVFSSFRFLFRRTGQEVFRLCSFQLQSFRSWRVGWNRSTAGVVTEKPPRNHASYSLRTDRCYLVNLGVA